jgi:hypothetical protein
MYQPKPYLCPTCGVELLDLPVTLLLHALSHAERRPFAGGRAEGDAPAADDQHPDP